MGLSSDKHLIHFASSGLLDVYMCIGQQSPEQDGEMQTREEKGAHRSESQTTCLSRTGNGLLASIWHPSPGLPLCIEEVTVQKTFTLVTGSGSPKTVTEMGQVVAYPYRLFSWKARQTSQVGLTSLSPSTHDPRGLKANGNWKQMGMDPSLVEVKWKRWVGGGLLCTPRAKGFLRWWILVGVLKGQQYFKSTSQ